jgi:hypothetical protein
MLDVRVHRHRHHVLDLFTVGKPQDVAHKQGLMLEPATVLTSVIAVEHL